MTSRKKLTNAQIGAIIRHSGMAETKARISHVDMYGNPVVHITDHPACTACIKPSPLTCEVCDGHGHTVRVRVFTVLTNGQFIAPLGGIAKAIPLGPDEADAWLNERKVRRTKNR